MNEVQCNAIHLKDVCIDVLPERVMDLAMKLIIIDVMET